MLNFQWLFHRKLLTSPFYALVLCLGLVLCRRHLLTSHAHASLSFRRNLLTSCWSLGRLGVSGLLRSDKVRGGSVALVDACGMTERREREVLVDACGMTTKR